MQAKVSLDRPRELRGTLLRVQRYLDLAVNIGLNPSASDRAVLLGLLDVTGDPDGGWACPGPELETTAIALRIAQLAGFKPPRVASTIDFVARCEDESLGLRLSPQGRATSVDALWGGLDICRSLGAHPSYLRAIAKNLALLQRTDGGLGTRHRAITTLWATWRGLEAEQLLSELKEH